MIVYDTITKTRSFAEKTRQAGKTIGFVPTMGALHEGHLSLVRKAKQENDVVIVSIFVNPIQFNNPDDLKKYPRTLENDLNMLAAVHCDAVFNPSVQEMYPEKVEKNYDFGELANVMEGAFRPGHFNGVAIVVQKLFEITLPHKAYFGEKDYQQVTLIRQMVADLDLPVEIIGVPIVRDPDGLAMSSRNKYLSADARATALVIPRAVRAAADAAASGAAGDQIVQAANSVLAGVTGVEVDYVALTDPSMAEAPPSGAARILITAVVDGTRLLDNGPIEIVGGS